MAKTSYSIVSSIDRSFLDHEITIGMAGFDAKPASIKQLLFLLGGLLVTAWAASTTFISSSGVVGIILFVIWAVITVLYFGGATKTKELRIRALPALVAYASRAARHVSTRRSSNPSQFASVVGIERVDEDGLIHFYDGTFGQAYLVVGSASMLLFDEDRTSILRRVDAFWRKVEPTCEYIFVTTKEPQRVHRAVASLERRNQALEVRDPDLLELQNEQYDIFVEHVGGKFTSIHQYLLIKGRTLDALRRGHMVVQAEVEGSSLMIKEATMLDSEETLHMLSTFYQGVEPEAFGRKDTRRTLALQRSSAA